MIQAKELRIDNWVYNSTTKENMLVYPMMIAQLSRLEKDGGHSVNIHPIPLTEEILLKCGFENEHDEIDGVYYDIYYVSNTDYVVEYKLKTKQYLFCFDSESGIGVEIKYLHQLQNLYFALCGEELEVKI